MWLILPGDKKVSPFVLSRSVAGLHQGGARATRTAWELWQTPLAGHEGAGGGERGALHYQVHPAADGPPLMPPTSGTLGEWTFWHFLCRCASRLWCVQYAGVSEGLRDTGISTILYWWLRGEYFTFWQLCPDRFVGNTFIMNLLADKTFFLGSLFCVMTAIGSVLSALSSKLDVTSFLSLHFWLAVDPRFGNTILLSNINRWSLFLCPQSYSPPNAIFTPETFILLSCQVTDR